MHFATRLVTGEPTTVRAALTPRISDGSIEGHGNLQHDPGTVAGERVEERRVQLPCGMLLEARLDDYSAGKKPRGTACRGRIGISRRDDDAHNPGAQHRL